MSHGTRTLCLNMIVRNEAAIIERCLAAAADHIACWIIVDTGSTDDTVSLIRSFFARRQIPGELHHVPFRDFEQARNAALARALQSALAFDYLLFLDADMELSVEAGDFRDRLQHDAYEVRQTCAISYWNVRLLRRDVPALYKGVTHEYLDVPHPMRLPDIWFVDHASGSNRVEKFERDVRLLRAGLEAEPENTRYWFYLAQSYRDAGRFSDAMECYGRRARMGGWDEEVWYAVLQYARCALADGQDAVFIQEALRAYGLRPSRAEPLYSLARYYRERDAPAVALAFCDIGRRIPFPRADLLFVEDFVYAYALDEEYAIVAFYAADPAVKAQGEAACTRLAQAADVPEQTRQLARSNLRWYTTDAGR